MTTQYSDHMYRIGLVNRTSRFQRLQWTLIHHTVFPTNSYPDLVINLSMIVAAQLFALYFAFLQKVNKRFVACMTWCSVAFSEHQPILFIPRRTTIVTALGTWLRTASHKAVSCLASDILFLSHQREILPTLSTVDGTPLTTPCPSWSSPVPSPWHYASAYSGCRLHAVVTVLL